MIAWRPFIVEGQVHDLAHLHPTLIRYTQAPKHDNPERVYEVQVEYGLHCFTSDWPPGSLSPEEIKAHPLAYADSWETRRFDVERYAHSKQLPAIVQNLPTAACYHTRHGNFFTVKLLNPISLEPQSYEVYFTASRSSVAPGRLNLFVQSAYVRDRDHDNQPKRKKVGFFVILHNTLHGQSIKPGP